MIDPMTEDDIAIDERAEEDAREQRWAEFVLDCARWGTGRMAIAAAHLFETSRSWDELGLLSQTEQIVYRFQETEGWSGVFAALARAIREQDA